MSVDFRTVILKGWMVTEDQQTAINQLTTYQYEDNFYRPNCYRDISDNNPLFFGDVIESFDCGDWVNACDYHGMGLSPNLIFVDNGVCDQSYVINLAAVAANDMEVQEVFSTPPQIYIISQLY